MSTTIIERRVAVTDRRAGRANAQALSQAAALSAVSGQGIHWRAVFAGALAGFAATIILTTLGAAIGITAAADSGQASGSAVGIGAGIWWLLTVIIAGVISGRVIASTARQDENYSAGIYGTLAWTAGVIIMLVLLAFGVGSIMGGLGGGLGAAAAQRGMPSVSPADSLRAANMAATVGAGAAWGLLLSQLLGLGATILGARRGHRSQAVHEARRGERTA